MVQILRGGCNTCHPASFFMSRPEGIDNYVLLIIRTPVTFQICEKQFVAEAGQAVLIAPETPYFYHNPKGEYLDDWLHFQITDDVWKNKADKIAGQLFPLENTEFFTNMLRQVLWENTYAKEEYRRESINACFILLMNHLFDCFEQSRYKKEVLPYQDRLRILRLELQSFGGKELSIQACAKRLGISETYFQHLYAKAFGVSFQQDLIHFRIEYAKHLLLSSDMTLDRVAQQCGYASEVHFYRQFKQQVHMTPAKYRKREIYIK